MAEIRVAIIGAGMSGIAQAIRLQQLLGSRVEIKVFEKASTAGGVWRDDVAWPGSSSDAQAHLYALWSDPNPDWSHSFATQKDILAYWQGLIRKHGLTDYFHYSTTFVSSTWSEESHTHTVVLRGPDGKEFDYICDVIVGAIGPLSTPVLPTIPGMDVFKGISFHNLRWDQSLKFEGKKVAVLGSGSSAVQFIPELAKMTGTTVTQYFRSGSYLIPKPNPPYSPLWRFGFRWVPGLQLLHRYNLFSDFEYHIKSPPGNKEFLSQYLVDNAPAKYIETLTPDYPLGCKRPPYDAGWLACLHRDNVELVQDKIVALDESGVVTQDGTHRPADIVIYATGSNVAEHGVGINVGVHGEGGVELRDYWKSIGGPQAFLGVATPGFPNVFQAIGPNSISGTWGFTLGVQTDLIARLIRRMVDYHITALQPAKAAFVAHNKAVQDGLALAPLTSSLCSNWWRIGGKGFASVPNSADGRTLIKQAGTIVWEDWEAKSRHVESSGKTIALDVNVRALELRRRLWEVARVLGVSGLLLALVTMNTGLKQAFKKLVVA